MHLVILSIFYRIRITGPVEVEVEEGEEGEREVRERGKRKNWWKELGGGPEKSREGRPILMVRTENVHHEPFKAQLIDAGKKVVDSPVHLADFGGSSHECHVTYQ